MEIRFSPEMEAQLKQLALASGKASVSRMLEQQARLVAGVQRGIVQADRERQRRSRKNRSSFSRMNELLPDSATNRGHAASAASGLLSD